MNHQPCKICIHSKRIHCVCGGIWIENEFCSRDLTLEEKVLNPSEYLTLLVRRDEDSFRFLIPELLKYREELLSYKEIYEFFQEELTPGKNYLSLLPLQRQIHLEHAAQKLKLNIIETTLPGRYTWHKFGVGVFFFLDQNEELLLKNLKQNVSQLIKEYE